jgi:hypothetical protein
VNDPWSSWDAAVQTWAEGLSLKAGELSTQMRSVLNEAVAGGLCDRGAVHQIKWAGNELRVSPAANGKTVRGHPAYQLRNLASLEDGALLGFVVRVGPKGQLLSFTVGIEGALRTSGTPWSARIDLTEKPEGRGPCGHPVLHAHVGPDDKAGPVARVPIRLLPPDQALRWLLVTVHPALESTA